MWRTCLAPVSPIWAVIGNLILRWKGCVQLFFCRAAKLGHLRLVQRSRESPLQLPHKTLICTQKVALPKTCAPPIRRAFCPETTSDPDCSCSSMPMQSRPCRSRSDSIDAFPALDSTEAVSAREQVFISRKAVQRARAPRPPHGKREPVHARAGIRRVWSGRQYHKLSAGLSASFFIRRHLP